MTTQSMYTPERTTTRPRIEPSKTWDVGDVVTVGKERWVIRTITRGKGVELEAMNASPGIWWRTTLANLPRKTSR